MSKQILTALFLMVPLVLSGTIHMLVVRNDWLAFLRRPIHEGRFGPNKTWRGFVVMPLATVVGVAVAAAMEPLFGSGLSVSIRHASLFPLGLVLGLGYVIAELPNSYIKRRRGIAAGALPSEKRLLFGFIDQADSAVGCTIAYVLFLPISLVTGAALILIGPLVHLGANVSLYVLGLRKSPV